jgi:hypothetical protein
MTDDEERELKGTLLMAQIANKEADTTLKARTSPMGAMESPVGGVGAGLAVASGLIALAAWIVAHLMQAGRAP